MNDILYSETDIAIIGMAAHLPGADTVAQYWHNLCNGVESIRRLSTEELLAAGESQKRLSRPNYVPAASILDGFDEFDAEFFGLSPKEAAIMDPQHRQFLEVAWEALEDAGYPPGSTDARTGVFAGCGMGSYFYFNLCSNSELVENTGMFLLRHTGNDKDFLTTRVSHIFDLKGPSLNIQTACSTSLVAVHLAAQSLLNGESDLALAGGVTIELPHARGYLYQDGEILSPDGHCHAFDHRAQGTVFGSGAGCVVLKRLSEAIADGDQIHAVIKGSAINNDGAAKAGYLAPSVDGQAEAIREAQAIAGISADTVGYVECHGTGTYLGDPIEVAALTQAFRASTNRSYFAKIGSVKTNIGHLDTAAGVASLIKAALSLREGKIPPSLGYEAPNPAIDFEGSPFSVNAALSDFPRLGAPRRAGVNSLGVGGTNAHVVLEEPPAAAPSEESDWPFQLFTLSARSRKALDAAAARLANWLRANSSANLADVAYTLKEGRYAFDYNRSFVASSVDEAVNLLEVGDRHLVFSQTKLASPEVVFMFPGGGAQYPNMARDLYETEPLFREWMDRGFEVLGPEAGAELRALWLPAPGTESAAEAVLTARPSQQLPLIMMVEYALAQLWMSWGITPSHLIGHSMGENTAAALAGVMSFEDCLRLVRLRGELFDTIPKGGMLSVPLTESELRLELGDTLDLASVNAPGLCVVSGPDDELERLAARLALREIETRRVAINIAAHSRMLEPILKPFENFLRSINLAAPQKIVISNRSGKPLTAAEATDPGYWVAHLRGTVQFAQGMSELSAPNRIFLECGPGKAMSVLAQANGQAAERVVSSLRHSEHDVADDVYFITMLGRLSGLGAPADWGPLWGGVPRKRIGLPTYPFQRSRYFIEPSQTVAASSVEPSERQNDLSAWGWERQWRPQEAGALASDLVDLPAQDWLVFTDAEGVAAPVIAALRSAGQRVITVAAGDRFSGFGTDHFTLAPEQGADNYELLLQDLRQRGRFPSQIAHFWLVTNRASHRAGSDFVQRNLEQGFWSLFWLAQSLAADALPAPVQITAFTTGAAALPGERLAQPEKAAIEGVLRVLPREVAGVNCAMLDLSFPVETDSLIEELLAPSLRSNAAMRHGRRFAESLRPVPLNAVSDLPKGAVVMITGGFGGIGLTLAGALAQRFGAKIGLVSRSGVPERSEWERILAQSPASGQASRIRVLQMLEAQGAEVIALAADVSNSTEMRAARQALEAKFGPVYLLIHGAGAVNDAPLLGRSELEVNDVFAPKLHAIRVLDDVFPDGSLAEIVVFSSTSTVIGAVGQTDYVAANAVLNAWAQSRSGGKTRVLALNWGIWADAGMAAEAVHGQKVLPPQPVQAPMLDAMGYDAKGRRLFTARWTADLWWLDGHRTRAGEALIPGTGYIDLIGQALRHMGEQGAFTLRDLTFLRPLAVPDHGARNIRLRFDPQSGWFEVQSEVQSGDRNGWVTHAEGGVTLNAPTAQAFNAAEIFSRCGAAIDGEGMHSPQEAHLNFGARWRVLNRMALGSGEGVADLALPAAFAGDLTAGHVAHPALLDLAIGWAMDLIEGYQPDHLWVPVQYAEIAVYRDLPERVVSHVQSAGRNLSSEGVARFNVSLATPEGEVVMVVRGFEIRRLDTGLALTSRPDLREIEIDEAQNLSPAAQRLRAALEQGIRASEGAEAFLRARAGRANPVYITPLPLPELVAAADTPESEAQSGQAFARPELESSFVAPRNGLERQLAAIWQELLGVQDVGIDDSFFDLGGHSLIAVRLFAQIRRAWQVDLPISTLFEAPTIAGIASLIEERIGPQDEAAPKEPSAPKKRYTHLVAMHPASAPAGQVPIFVVAGMFGNVLNLRHLGQMVGTERPFYGLQARGLFGDAKPHDDFAQAARDYLAEARQVHPGGPWLLGGFSGGGLIAWEMARQLEAEGEEVAGVVLLDTPLPVRPALSRGDKLRMKLQDLRKGGFGYLREWRAARQAWAAQQATGPEARAEGQLNNAEIEAAFRAALPRYQLAARSGTVLLYRPAPQPRWALGNGHLITADRDYIFPDNLWTAYAPGLEITEVPGDHDSMVLEPNVRVLASHLRRRLRELAPASTALAKAP